MSSLKNDRFLKAAWREPVDQTPVWIMRQAGRYLPEYRAVREQAGSFMRLCKTPELVCEVTLQPLARFNLDAAIIFSDILTIPDAMGLGLEVVEHQGPRFRYPVKNTKDIHRLSELDVNQLHYVYESIMLTKKALHDEVPLIGFCGSPWTLAAYMIEGESKKGFKQALGLLEEQPDALHHLLTLLARAVSSHLNQQIKAGVDAVMIFDTWGGLLSPSAFENFSLFYMEQVLTDLHRVYQQKKIPVILFTKGGSRFLDQIAKTRCDVVGLDEMISLHEARQRVGHQVALQGNMPPACLLENPETIRQTVENHLASFGEGPGHIFNLSHGITPDVPPEHVKICVDTVHAASVRYHR